MAGLFKNELSGRFLAVPIQNTKKSSEDSDKSEIHKEKSPTVGWFNYKWTCDKCSITCENILELEKHSLEVHKKRCRNSCDKCDKFFSNYATFINHENEKHQPLLKYRCIVCSELTSTFVQLHQHIEQKHPQYEIFICLYCGVTKISGSQMYNHLIDKHVISNLLYFCDFCPKDASFHKKALLLSHMKTHHLSKKHICECCALSFSYKSELIEHQKSKHLEQEQKLNFGCKFDMCNQVFKTSKRLKIHMKLHENSKILLSCNYCGKKFAKHRLKSHMKVNNLMFLMFRYYDIYIFLFHRFMT